MAAARALHDIFADLAGGGTAAHAWPAEAAPAEALREGGHTDLPDGLLTEAIISYADTAPAEVAEHLAPFVTAHSPVPPEDSADDSADGPAAAGSDLAQGMTLLATAPVPDPGERDPAEVDAGEYESLGAGDFGAGDLPDPDSAELADDPFDLEFGEGGGAGAVVAPAGVDLLEADFGLPADDLAGLSPTQPGPDPTEPEPVEPDPTQPQPGPGPTDPNPPEPPGGAFDAG